jgi:hypothetical protein
VTPAASSSAADAVLPEEMIQVELRDPRLAAFLAWLVPGAGHFYQGRTGKAILFMVCILGTWLFGMYLGAGRVVYVAWRPDDIRWAYFCQVGIGLPAVPALLQFVHSRRNPHAEPLWGGIMAPPLPPGRRAHNDMGDLHDWQKDLHHYFELGTVFTMIAGLLNVLAIYDAWGGPLLIIADDKEEDEDAKEDAKTPAAT